jgi:hypothetical protein
MLSESRLAYRQHEVVPAFPHQLVELGRPVLVHLAVRHLRARRWFPDPFRRKRAEVQSVACETNAAGTVPIWTTSFLQS